MTAVDQAERALGKTRLEALSDGVFAIAMTLLVLDIRMPELAPKAPLPEIGHALKMLGPMFFSFLITFVLAGSFWYMHHVTIHNMKYVTRGLAAINILFLMFISLLPFSTSLLGRLGPGRGVALLVYFGNQLALGLVLNGLWIFARRHRLLETPIVDPRMRYTIAAQPLACVAALVAALPAPVFSYYMYLLVMIVARRLARRKYPAMPASAPAPL